MIINNMKNIHLLPTDKSSRLIIYSTLLNEFRLLDKPIKNWKHKRHIYITNNEDIKEGDWVYNIASKTKFKATKKLIDLINDPNVTLTTNKKITLTTDTDLIKNGVQSIDDEFLEWFVKNPSCEVVEVIKTAPIRPFGSLYKTIIPKEKPKPIYQQIIDIVGGENKFKEILKIESKQETLEEAAERLFNYHSNNTSLAEGHYDYMMDKEDFKQAAYDLVKWQAERMYSEEDIKQFGLYLGNNLKKLKGKTIDEIFEQFKKEIK